MGVKLGPSNGGGTLAEGFTFLFFSLVVAIQFKSKCRLWAIMYFLFKRANRIACHYN
jgi:hypothetical protein